MYEKQDVELCSNNVSSPYWSEGQKLSMIFSSGQTQGVGFKARFLFVTGGCFWFYKFKINNFFKKIMFFVQLWFDRILDSGNTVTIGRMQLYVFECKQKTWRFQLASTPGQIPVQPDVYLQLCTVQRRWECPSLFWPVQSPVCQRLDHLLRVCFVIITNFSSCVCRPTTITLTITHWFSFYRNHCREDWVEIYNVFPRGREVLLGRYCGDSTPGPVESDAGTIGLKVIYLFLSLFCWQLVFIPSATLIGSTIKVQLHFTPAGYFAHWRRGCLQRLQSQIHVRRK